MLHECVQFPFSSLEGQNLVHVDSLLLMLPTQCACFIYPSAAWVRLVLFFSNGFGTIALTGLNFCSRFSLFRCQFLLRVRGQIIHIHNDHISPPTPTRTRTCTNARHRASVLICMNVGLSFATAPRSQAILTTYPMGTEHESRGDSAGSPVICSSTFQKLTLSYMLRHSNRVNVRVSWEGRGSVKLSRLGGCVVCFPQWSGLVRIELGEDCIQLNVTIGNQKHMT